MQRHNMSFFKRIVIFMALSGVLIIILGAFVFTGSETVDVYLANFNGKHYTNIIPEYEKEGIEGLQDAADDEKKRLRGLKTVLTAAGRY